MFFLKKKNLGKVIFYPLGLTFWYLLGLFVVFLKGLFKVIYPHGSNGNLLRRFLTPKNTPVPTFLWTKESLKEEAVDFWKMQQEVT